jgi:hypothetical protein
MATPDCPYGVNATTKTNNKQDGVCVGDYKYCFNKTCPLGNWRPYIPNDKCIGEMRDAARQG